MVNLFSTAVPFWGQTTKFLYSLSSKRDCVPKRIIDFGIRMNHEPLRSPEIATKTMVDNFGAINRLKRQRVRPSHRAATHTVRLILQPFVLR